MQIVNCEAKWKIIQCYLVFAVNCNLTGMKWRMQMIVTHKRGQKRATQVSVKNKIGFIEDTLKSSKAWGRRRD